MAMNHGGGGSNLKALRISAVLIFVYFFAEITVALVTGSLSLLADAAHELSTVVAIAVSLIAIRLSSSPPTPKRTFGLLRGEALAALLNGLLLVAMAVFIIVRGLDRLSNPVEMEAGPMFAMAIGGIGLEIASLFIMFRGQKEDLNIRASFWHVMNAFFGSVAVIVAAIFIAVAEVYEADTWAGMVFAVVLLWAAYGIVRDALRVLVDAAPEGTDIEAIRGRLLSISGVQSSHHLHIRTVTGSIKTFSGHLVVADGADPDAVLQSAKQVLDDEFGLTLSTIQVEHEGLVEGDPAELEYQDRNAVPGDGSGPHHRHGDAGL
jgi:cobalt-zinc-cadmium efflux system protein